ncbi:DUF2017 family protein [Bowdeniella nasicola]|uniref:DUF2017 family protein n=1 Tax=Bowdeniella nasicola TaxID=208480 RepID=UPI00116110D4|nr:DUF2017 family protein [Bowdeniella nasicola]
MRGFSRAAQGYISVPDVSARLMVAKAVEDLGDILGRPLEGVPDKNSDDEVLAALDFDVADTKEEAGDDPALDRLLPAMSMDEDAAEELRLDSERRIRNAKARHLRDLHAILLSEDERVLVPYGSEPEVLAALTDVRLLIAERLDISEPEDIEALREVYLARDEDYVTESPRARQTMVLLEVYSFLTWWQDSLLLAMGEGEIGS